MMNVKSIWVALLMGSALFGQAVKPNLLPTEVVAKKIAAIQSEILHNDKLTLPARERQVERIKSLVTEFVIAQLQAEPRLATWQLHRRLVQLLSIPFETNAYVFQVGQPCGDGPTVWAVAYEAYVSYARTDRALSWTPTWSRTEKRVLQVGAARKCMVKS
jgi:hypothetical protein